MKKVYTHENLFLIHNVKNLMERQGIEVIIKNEFSSGAAGEIAVFDTWPELWVIDDRDEIRALNIADSADNGSSLDVWYCRQCGEENDGSFEICWQCQAPNFWLDKPTS